VYLFRYYTSLTLMTTPICTRGTILAQLSGTVSYYELGAFELLVPQSIAEILGLGKVIRSLVDLESAVAAGLPKRSLELLSARLHADNKTAKSFQFKIVPQATWKRRTKRLSADESERTERVARVLAHAEYVWDDRDHAREWMNKPHRELHNVAPVEVARTELGARRVEDLLEKLFYGLPV
jgi:putative toxin-antitoxin system antitoxin component (TIGR02293 family)